jgi:aliphatic nitrilase
MAEAIRIRATAHSFEGKLFTIVACSAISEEIIAAMSADRPGNRDLFERPNSAFSGVIDPHGNVVGDPLIDAEGIVYADIDLNTCIQPKQMHDIIGGYNRFDIFDLRIDRRARVSATFQDHSAPLDEPDEAARADIASAKP